MKSIQSLSTSFIVAFGLAIVSGATLAQIQGLAAPNYSLGSPQSGGETGGTSNTRPAQPRNPNAGQGTLYNYAPGQGNNQAQPQQRRGTYRLQTLGGSWPEVRLRFDTLMVLGQPFQGRQGKAVGFPNPQPAALLSLSSA